MELSTLGRGVYESDLPRVREEIEKADEEVIQLAMLVSVMHTINRKHPVNKRIARRLLDTADPNWKSIRGETLLFLAVSSASPGKVDWSPSDSAISIGDEVIGKAEGIAPADSPLGCMWLTGVVVDSVDASTVRVHFTDIGSSTTLTRGPEGVVSDLIPVASELTPGIRVLFKHSSTQTTESFFDFQQSSSNNFVSSRPSVKFDRKKVTTDSDSGYYLEGSLSAINARGGYDITTLDGNLHQNIVAESVRILEKVSLGYKPIARALIIQGQSVRVIEKGTSESWRGVVKGRNTSGGFEVLYPDDGDFETDVPVVELFTPERQPDGDGGGGHIISELASRDAHAGIALPVACKQNNKSAISLMLKHSKRPYLGLTTLTFGNGLRVIRINERGPASGILMVGDVITNINSVAVSKSRGPFYWEYSNLIGTWSLLVIRNGSEIPIKVEAIQNRLDHESLYLRQRGLDLTLREDIAKMLIEDGAKMNISKCIQKHWYEAAEMLVTIGGSSIDADEVYRGRYALELSARIGSVSLVEKLLKLKVKVNSVSFLGHTPLLSACMSPLYSTRLYLVKLLLKNGARPKGTRALAAALKVSPRWYVGMSCIVTITKTCPEPPLKLGEPYKGTITSRDQDTYTVLIHSSSTSVSCSSEEITMTQWPVGTDAVDSTNNIITVTTDNNTSSLSDLPRGETLLAICRILLRDTSAELPTRRRYRPVGLLERYQKENVLELVDTEDTALFLMKEVKRQRLNTHYIHPAYATERGWLAVLKVLQDLKVDWDIMPMDTGMPAVGAAIKTVRSDLLEFLLAAGADPDGETSDGRSFCLLAVECCGTESVSFLKQLFKYNNTLEAKDTGALGLACKMGNLDVVNYLLSKGARVESRYGKHRSYAWACIDPTPIKEEILLKLMDHKAIPNLAEVVYSDYIAAATKLLTAKPQSASDRSSRGNTPLIIACTEGNKTAFNLLLKHDSDVDVTNDDGRCALFRSCGLDDHQLGAEFVKALLDNGARIQATEALGYAISNSNTECVRLLLSNDQCNPNEKWDQKDPIEIAMDNPEMAALLCTHPELEVTTAEIAMGGSEFFDAIEIVLSLDPNLDVDDVDDEFGRTTLAWICMEPFVCYLTGRTTALVNTDTTSPIWKELHVTFNPSLEQFTYEIDGTAHTTHARHVTPITKCNIVHKDISVLCKSDDHYRLAIIKKVHKNQTCEVKFIEQNRSESGDTKTVDNNSLVPLRCKTLLLAKLMLERGADINATDSVGKSVLFLSVETGDFETTSFIIDQGGDVQESGAMIAAAQKGSVPLTELLLKHGGTVMDTWHGKYPAAVSKTLEVTQILLDILVSPAEITPATDDQDDKDQCQEIPEQVGDAAIPCLARCCRQEWVGIVATLTARYPHLVNKPGEGGIRPTEAACMKGNEEILRLLIDAKADLRKPNQLGESPLLVAARTGHSRCVEMMVEHVNPLGSRALAASVSCGHLSISKVLIEGIEHHDASELPVLVSEQYNGKDVFTATTTQEEAATMIDLIPTQVLDKHLIYFASMAWNDVVSKVLSVETSVTLEGLGKAVEVTTKHLSGWPKIYPGIPQGTKDCIVVDMQSKEKWHGEICSRDVEEEGMEMYLIRYEDGTKEKTLECEIFYEVEKEAYEAKVDRWWQITRDLLSHILKQYGSEGVSTAIRVTGSSDPVQNLLIALRTTCRAGLRFMLDGLTSGIDTIFDDRFAVLASRIKVQLCSPPQERTLDKLVDISEEERLRYFVYLHNKYINDIFNESSLSMACHYGWVRAVERIASLPNVLPQHSNAACTEVCKRLKPLLSSPSSQVGNPAAIAAADEDNFENLAKILEILILKGAKVEAAYLDTICAVKVRLESEGNELTNEASAVASSPHLEPKVPLSANMLNPPGAGGSATSAKGSSWCSEHDVEDELKIDLLNMAKVSSRWTVCVARQHIIEVETGTKYVQFNKDMKLGLLHLAAYHNDIDCIKQLLQDTDGEGANTEDTEESGCIPRDFTTKDDCHNLLLREEQSKNRIPNISDIDMVIGVKMDNIDVDISVLIANFLFGKKQVTPEQRESQLRTEQIQEIVESLGIGAFLWTPYADGVFIICNASLMRLEVEARRSLLSFSKEASGGIYEFSSGSRQYLVEHILNTRSGNLETWKCCEADNNNGQPCAKCGKHAQEVISTEMFLERLQADGSIKRIFGVHDSVERADLRILWKYQPFSSLRSNLLEPSQSKEYPHAAGISSYLGPKLAFYFLFLSFYLSWLIPLMLTGATFTIIQVYVNSVDNKYTLANGIFATIWSAAFVQRWKRKSSEYAFIFGTREYERLAIPSSEFLQANKHRGTKEHPITGLQEPDFDFWDRIPRMLASYFITCVMIAAVVGIMYQNIRLRKYLDPTGDDLWMLIVAGVENAGSVIVMDAIYSHVVDQLSIWENHRTNEDFEQSFTAKAFGFRFVNGFSGLTYTALTETPKQLLIQLASLLVTQAAVSMLKEKIVAGVILWYRTRKQKRGVQGVNNELGMADNFIDDEREAIMLEDSQKPTLGSRALFEDYSMIILQFSYVISFACVLPAAPIFAFVASYLELHSDFYKYLFLGQRSSPEKASGIGVWLSVLHIVTIISIFFNAIVIFRQGVSWKKHTWLIDFFTDNSTCQSIAGFLSTVLVLFMVNVAITTSINDTARWVRNSELSQKFSTSRVKMKKNTPTNKDRKTTLIQVTPSSKEAQAK